MPLKQRKRSASLLVHQWERHKCSEASWTKEKSHPLGSAGIREVAPLDQFLQQECHFKESSASQTLTSHLPGNIVTASESPRASRNTPQSARRGCEWAFTPEDIINRLGLSRSPLMIQNKGTGPILGCCRFIWSHCQAIILFWKKKTLESWMMHYSPSIWN